MTTPMRHEMNDTAGSLSRQYPFRPASYSLATCAFIVLAVLGTTMTRTSALFSALVAACLVSSASACVLHCYACCFSYRSRHRVILRHKLASALTAVGGLTSLGVGMLNVVSAITSSARIHELSWTALSIAMPCALLCLTLGGLAQLPHTIAGFVAGSISLPALVAYFALSSRFIDHPVAYLLCALASVLLLARTALRILRSPHYGWQRLLSAGACLVAASLCTLSWIGHVFGWALLNNAFSYALACWLFFGCVLAVLSSACLISTTVATQRRQQTPRPQARTRQASTPQTRPMPQPRPGEEQAA